MSDNVTDVVLAAIEASLEAQLKSVRRLRRGLGAAPGLAPGRPTQTGLAYTVLEKAGEPLHVDEIIRRVGLEFRILLDRDSLASALNKKSHKGEQFERAGRNTFGILPGGGER